MNKSFGKVRGIATRLAQFCCFGNATGFGYAQSYSRATTTQINLIEPYFDDVMQPICDGFDVEMFV